ncbi:MAG TPA: TVP38/TMEM64 family protein [Candidatus Competibacter denitrificans]|nr:hypothetical protein [Candidatus Competibacteraceae bacterium]HRC70867.1 TVP38/TMEM64 family protein [Candidatus Competibacter denitrificans]
MPESRNRYWPILGPLLLVSTVGLLVVISQGVAFDLDFLKTHAAALTAYRLDHPRLVALLYFFLYLMATSLSVPGVIVLSVAGGAVFGLFWGTVLASFASTFGGTLAFLAARRFLRDTVRRYWGQRLALIEAGMARDGPFYLFGMRLVPVIPYFLINLLMGLTPMPTATFYWISQLGMLPLLIVYVNAGTQLARLSSLQDLFSPTLLLSLGLIAIFPWLARGMVMLVGRYRTVSGNRDQTVASLAHPIARNDRPANKNP